MLLWLIAAGLGTAHAGDAAQLEAVWQDVVDDSVWQSPTVLQRQHFQEGFQQLLAASQRCQPRQINHARETLLQAGFDVHQDQVGDTQYLLVVEVEGHRRGGGMYAIRCGPALPQVIQAPHAMYDLKTGAIAWSLFAESGVRAGMWNTVHRYRSRPDEQREEDLHPADVCHEFGSFFQAATVAAATADPTLRFVQLHGFASGRGEVDIIISSGAPTTPPRAFSERLGDALGDTGLYGVDVHILGGSTNVQRRFLVTTDEGRFLHLEMTLPVREELLESSESRAFLLQALEGSWR